LAEETWLLVGLIVGMGVGIPLGFILAQFFMQKSASVIFDRDAEGRISGIHYVPKGV
jgi:hypothetical protein